MVLPPLHTHRTPLLPAHPAPTPQRTALHVAADAGHKGVVGLLLFKGAEPAVDRWGQTPRRCAARHRGAAFRTIEAMLAPPIDRAAYAELATKEGAAKTARAAKFCNNRGTKGSQGAAAAPLLGSGPPSSKVASAEAEMDTATKELLDAAAQGDLTSMKALATRGADCSQADYDRRTPLHLAATAGNLQMLRFLVAQPRVRVNVCDRFGHTPLQDAAQHGFEACAAFLKSHGATSVDQRCGFALCASAAKGDLAQLRALQLQDVDLGTADYDGRTALHLAVAEAHGEVVAWLLEQESAQAALNAADCMQQTPLDVLASAETSAEGKEKSLMVSLRARRPPARMLARAHVRCALRHRAPR